jgi:hypothetical protein
MSKTGLGNLDCGNTLSFGSTEQVRRHVTECLQAGQGNGGHILCASNAITASVPLENYLAAVNAYRDFFGLPRIELARMPGTTRLRPITGGIKTSGIL